MRTARWVAACGAVTAFAGAGLLALADGPADRDQRGSSVPDGATLFQLKGCAQCHDGPDSTGSGAGPPLRDAATWAGTRRPGMGAAAYLEESILAPDAFRAAGGTFEMPTLVLTADEVDRLVVYLLEG